MSDTPRTDKIMIRRDGIIAGQREIELADLARELERKLAARPEVDAIGVGQAAYDFRETLVPKADQLAAGQFPLWHGWAIYDAFVAGAAWQRSPQKTT